jgi:hypothetical protein
MAEKSPVLSTEAQCKPFQANRGGSRFSRYSRRVFLFDDRFIFNGSALLDYGLFAVAITINHYAGRRTNMDAYFLGCCRHHVANARAKVASASRVIQLLRLCRVPYPTQG